MHRGAGECRFSPTTQAETMWITVHPGKLKVLSNPEIFTMGPGGVARDPWMKSSFVQSKQHQQQKKPDLCNTIRKALSNHICM